MVSISFFAWCSYRAGVDGSVRRSRRQLGPLTRLPPSQTRTSVSHRTAQQSGAPHTAQSATTGWLRGKHRAEPEGRRQAGLGGYGVFLSAHLTDALSAHFPTSSTPVIILER